MAIYNIFDYYEKEMNSQSARNSEVKIDPEALTNNRIDEHLFQESSVRSQFFSALAARVFFFLLLVADIVWGVYAVCSFAVKGVLCLLTLFQLEQLTRSLGASWLSIKRSIVCAIALLVAIFSPALGIMFSCMYFLMYDKEGIDEVVPASLKEQFQTLFP